MPIDPASTTAALIEYGALGLFIIFLLYREWANSTERKEIKKEHDIQKSELILLLTDSQNKRIEESRETQHEMFEATQILGNAMDFMKATAK